MFRSSFSLMSLFSIWCCSIVVLAAGAIIFMVSAFTCFLVCSLSSSLFGRYSLEFFNLFERVIL